MRLVLCDSQLLLLDALAAALAGVGHEVVATCHRPDDLPDLLTRHQPQACLLEVVYQGASRLEPIADVRRTHPDAALLVLTADATAPVWAAFDASVVDGVVSKASSFSVVDAAIYAAVEGRQLVTGFRRPVAPPRARLPRQDLDDLTQRETEVLRLLVDGLSTRSIATALGVSRNTVRTHVANVLRKLSVHDRGKAVSSAVELGILDTVGG